VWVDYIDHKIWGGFMVKAKGASNYSCC